MPGPNMITPAQLMRQIGMPDAPIVVDVRITDDISPDNLTIPTACFYDYREVEAMIARIGQRRAVIVCHKGKKISQGVAALVRAGGGQAEVLEGGFVAWLGAALPTFQLAELQDTRLWVTRQRPKIDRIACPWLIRRFIEPDAKFLFVPRDDVLAVADRFGATPFDVQDAKFAHVGPQCTFDALIDEFGLTHQPLLRMAKIIRAADTDDLSDTPQAAGLLAISIGYSKMHRDDTAMLNAAMPVYDALYRWARDGFEESHSE